MRRLVYGVLPGLILAMALAAGWLKWYEGSQRAGELARAETIDTASEFAVKMLSFRPDTIEGDLAGAQQLMTDDFRDRFAPRARDQIVPDAKARNVTAAAEVSGAASVRATGDHAAVLVFADRTVTVGSAEPADVDSSYLMTLDKVDGRWLVADFEPV